MPTDRHSSPPGTPLPKYFFPDPDSVSGEDFELLLDTLRAFKEEQGRARLVILHDGCAGCTDAVKLALKAEGIFFLFQPSNSPDLQPAEFLWAFMEFRLTARGPYKTQEHFFEVLHEVYLEGCSEFQCNIMCRRWLHNITETIGRNYNNDYKG